MKYTRKNNKNKNKNNFTKKMKYKTAGFPFYNKKKDDLPITLSLNDNPLPLENIDIVIKNGEKYFKKYNKIKNYLFYRKTELQNSDYFYNLNQNKKDNLLLDIGDNPDNRYEIVLEPLGYIQNKIILEECKDIRKEDKYLYDPKLIKEKCVLKLFFNKNKTENTEYKLYCIFTRNKNNTGIFKWQHDNTAEIIIDIDRNDSIESLNENTSNIYYKNIPKNKYSIPINTTIEINKHNRKSNTNFSRFKSFMKFKNKGNHNINILQKDTNTNTTPTAEPLLDYNPDGSESNGFIIKLNEEQRKLEEEAEKQRKLEEEKKIRRKKITRTSKRSPFKN